MDRLILGPDGRPRFDGVKVWQHIQGLQMMFALRANKVPDVTVILELMEDAKRDGHRL